ncbi:hypothetical protein [Nakamurella lactea]|uniref:hypothetical protein n=1 Tax=Nakamurella lactea TaxID=459515 RepID=UPI0012B61595|nr:hypothetical protein [Nakamurella lactea]
MVAPTTLATALLFYFGWAHLYWFFNYFGIDATVLGPSTTDYLMRSVDALFIPLIVIAAVCLAVMWGHTALPDRWRSWPRTRRQTGALVGIGILLLLNGLSRLVVITVFNRGLCVAPMSVIVGILLIWYVIVLRRRRRWERDPTAPRRSEAANIAEWAVMFVLIAMSLFWIATDYSVAVGQTRARQLAAEMPVQPGVVLFSEKDLQLSSSEIRTTECSNSLGAESAYRFRYDGLILLIEIGGHYVLLPRTWRRGADTAIVIPQDDVGTLRFEFASSAGYRPPPAC